MKRRTAMTLGASILASALLLTGCSAGSGGTSTPTATKSKALTQAQIDKAMNTPTTITMWSWASFITPEIAQFETKYPNIKVNLVNVGQGQAEYTKITDAISSGTGAPDLAMMDYSIVPEFVLTKSLEDLSQFGAAATEKDYTPTAWQSVTSGSGIFGLPQNTGPMVFYYRSDLFQKAGIEVPKTWDQFTTAADTLKQKTGAQIVDFDPSNMNPVFGMFQQAGVNPLNYDGNKTVTINFSNPKVKKVADLMTKLIQSGDADVSVSLTPDWYQGFANDKYAGWLIGAYGQNNLSSTLVQQTGQWSIAPMPQWSASDNVGGTAGGSATVMIKGTKNGIAAYELGKFLFNDPTIVAEGANKAYPALKSALNSTAFVESNSPFFANQQANKLYSQVSASVKTPIGYLPFMGQANTSFNDTVGQAMTAKKDLYPAFQAWEKQLISYAKQQGFTIKK